MMFIFLRTTIAFVIITQCKGLKIYKSTIPIETDGGVSGLQYLNSGNNPNTFKDEFTICLRFNFKRLGPNARILSVDSPFSSQKDYVWLIANYPNTWFGVGHMGHDENTYSNWVLLDPNYKTNLWIANKWHHFCLSFSRSKSNIIAVLVS